MSKAAGGSIVAALWAQAAGWALSLPLLLLAARRLDA